MTSSFLFDVSIVLNTQAGSTFLIRALRSLEEAAYEARRIGLRVELLFVMNRSPPAHLALAGAFTSVQFDEIRLMEVSRDSLGAAREDGLHGARGEYIMFADDDDLVSSNSIVAFHRLARVRGPSSIVIPQYLIGFGAFHIIAEYSGSDVASPLALIKYHPYISRIFLHSSARIELHYADVPPKKGYGYEDWHFNATAIAKGYDFVSAPGTILFYRQRAAGLLNQYNVVSTRHIPPSALFKPDIYLAVCQTSFADFNAGVPRPMDLGAVQRGFVDDLACRTYTHQANQIDPSIDWSRIVKGAPWASWTGDLRCGAAYYRACGLVVGRVFDHVLLCDTLADAFVVRRLILVLDALRMSWPTTRILVLVGRGAGAGLEAKRLEARGALVVDLGSLQADLPPEDRDAITLRLIETTAPAACLHLFGGDDARRFFASCRAVLGGMKAIYYRDIDRVSIVDGLPSIDGADLSFVSETLASLSAIACDCRHAMERDRSRIAFLDDRWGYFHSAPSLPVHSGAYRMEPRDGPTALLWVAGSHCSRSIAIVELVAEALAAAGVEAEIHVLTGHTSHADASCFRLAPGASFDQAQQMPRRSDLGEYDALVHTAPTENLPIVVIDAVALGLPVVALGAGGLDEVVIDGRTGRLIRPAETSDVVADLAASIGEVRRGSPGQARRAADAAALVGRRSSRERAAAFLAAAIGHEGRI